MRNGSMREQESERLKVGRKVIVVMNETKVTHKKSSKRTKEKKQWRKQVFMTVII